MISIRGVSKWFGKKKAVDNLNLEVGKGEIFAFLGPNGAGKTTTIKMITGLIRPMEGSVLVGGMDVQRERMKVKEILGYIPDQPYLYDKLTGMEFLRFMADIYRVPAAERGDRIDRFVAIFSMGDFVNDLTEGYSHGMRQRLALAATLLHKPEVIIVDEPLVGLDPHSSKIVRDLFQEESRRGTTIFMSTHLISIAEEIAQRIGIILDGRLTALGTAAELRARAQTNGRLEDAFLKIVAEKATYA